jgi:hypothetical protein
MKVLTVCFFLLFTVYATAQSPEKYLLMKPGDDYEKPLSKITLTIIVK